MLYKDRIYGEAEIEEPVILELINCPSLQRLKDIDSAGYLEPFIPGSTRNRFDHSVGVFLLLKIYGAPIEEQIAGLIHDVSHAAFSHCIDYVLEGASQKNNDHQDNIFDEFVRQSEIPAILKKYNFDLEYILADKNFSLKEKNLPDLCADRIDYSLEFAVVLKVLDEDSLKYFLDNLTAENGNWIFKNFTSAKKYADLFFWLNTKYFTCIFLAVMYRTVGDYLRHALKNSYILKEDLYTTDKIVLAKIAPYHNKDEKLKLFFDRMNNKIPFRNDPENYDAEVFCKSRIVDPLCKENGQIKRVSQIDENWSKIVEEELKPKQYFIKFNV